MLDISNPTRNAFREPPGSDTSQLLPMHSMPPIAGGIAYVRIGANFPIGHRQALVVRDLDELLRERDIASLELVCRCLGVRRGPRIETCSVMRESDSIDNLKLAHPSLYELKEQHEVHIFALYSGKPLDAKKHEEATKQYDERVALLGDLSRKGKILEEHTLRTQWGWHRTPLPPAEEIVGLCISQAMSGQWEHVHPDRGAR